MNPLLDQVEASLLDQDVNAAWRTARAALIADPVGGAALLGRVAPEKWHEPTASAVVAWAGGPDDPDRAFAAGRALAEVDPEAAAAVLGWAHARYPDSTPILLELVAALELGGAHAAARTVLAGATRGQRAVPMVSFLFGFHELIAGAAPPELALDGGAELEAHLRMRWARMRGRAAQFPYLDPASRVVAVSGCLPVEISVDPVAEDGARTAVVWSTVAGAVQAWSDGAEVRWLGGEAGERVARGLAARLGREASPFSGEPGVLVLPDLEVLTPERAASLRHRGDVLIYADFADSTREHELAPDLLGLLAPRWSPPEDDPFADEPGPVDVPLTPIRRSPNHFERWRAADPAVGPAATPRERLWAGLAGPVG